MRPPDEQPLAPRIPTRREQLAAAGIFTIIAGLFVFLFVVWFASQFHWLLLALAVFSLLRAARHAMVARKIS